jgi:hypothetical protein
MNKYFKLIVLLLISNGAFAGGTVGFSQDVVQSSSSVSAAPTFSLNVFESISDKYDLYYQSWTGIRPTLWFQTDHSLMKPVSSRVTLGIGPSYRTSNGIDVYSIKVYSEYRLW